MDGESKLEAKDDGFRHWPFPFERKERTLLQAPRTRCRMPTVNRLQDEKKLLATGKGEEGQKAEKTHSKGPKTLAPMLATHRMSRTT